MMPGRREFMFGAVGGLLGSLVLARRGSAQQAAVPLAKAERVIRLSNRLSLVTTGRTNVLVLSTADGLVLIDSGAPDRSGALMESVRQLSRSGRVETVFNTHWHLENTGANDLLRQAGATIVAHVNTRLWMTTPTWVPAEDRYRQPRSQNSHPNVTFYVEGSMNAGGERIEYGYLVDAHTSGDIYVFFRDSNVLAVGDVASPARDPDLDWFTGAWLGGRVDAMDRLLTLSNGDTQIVPGYGPVMTHAELKAERDMLQTIYDRAVDRVREGDSVDDMLDAGVMNGLVRTFADPRAFLFAVHRGLWAHHNKLAPNVV